MKELTAIKLINWHYFTNETIKIKGSALFTGDNGSGKSTILDALQYVLVADLRHVKFNISAHDETKRDILGYLRCKTGSDSENGQKYRRSGDITSYIVLEFLDTNRDKKFLLGAVIDSYGDNLNWKSNFFKIEDCELDDAMFFNDRRPRNIKDFKIHVQGLKSQIYSSSERYRADLQVKLGSLGERFFSLFVKAISFKPITDIRSFVYAYVLDEKSVNIEVMKENFRRYKEFSELVAQTNEKIARLDEIRSRFKELQTERERALIQDYLIKAASLEKASNEMDETVNSLDMLEGKLEGLKDLIESLRVRDETLEREYNSYRDILASNTAFQLMERLNAEIEIMKKEKAELQSEMQVLLVTVSKEVKALEQFMKLAAAAAGIPPEAVDTAGKLLESLAGLVKGKYTEEALIEGLDSALSSFGSLSGELGHKIWEQKGMLNELVKEEQLLNEELRGLKERKFTYDPKITELRLLIREKLKERTGHDVNPAILCELLDIKNEKWQDAVEGFLNTQRFDLIVEPQYFDASLSIYERHKKERKISGVGLVNTGKVMEFQDKQFPNSLAEEVISPNRYAKAYVNQLMGNVTKCENEQQLKNHKRSVTPTCMTYMNNTARQINFKVYETPYIGERAFAKQIEKKEHRVSEIVAQKGMLTSDIKSLEDILDCIKAKDGPYAIIKDKLRVLDRVDRLEYDIKTKEKELQGVDTSDIDEINKKLSVISFERKRNAEELSNATKESGVVEEKITSTAHRLEALKLEKEAACSDLEAFEGEYSQVVGKGHERYEKERRDRTPLEIISVFTTARKGLETAIQKKQSEVFARKNEYNARYHFWARAELDDIDDYEQEYVKLVESELPEYEGKIETSKKEAEEEFKEHFIYKLKENITNAKNEFDILNDALKDIQFGSDRYRFTISPEPSHKKFYDMIMDEELFEGYSLFDTVFREKHREAMDELFDRIINQPDDMIMRSISEYTDYRTFLDYDIRITHSNGETSTFSKVCREKSGGETQTPYYVAIVASFCQLYRIKSNKESVRLIMFDEAFNRMDSDRIENMLKFTNGLGMQVIIAAPTDKCEYITPLVPTTMLVIRDGHYSWIEDYKRMKAAN